MLDNEPPFRDPDPASIAIIGKQQGLKGAARDPLQVAETIERIVETLWTQIEPRMVALHRAGMPLASIWIRRGARVA